MQKFLTNVDDFYLRNLFILIMKKNFKNRSHTRLPEVYTILIRSGKLPFTVIKLFLNVFEKKNALGIRADNRVRPVLKIYCSYQPQFRAIVGKFYPIERLTLKCTP